MRAAPDILAEIGTDMSRFPTDRHLASWAKVCPGNNESGGRRRSGYAGKGNRPHRPPGCAPPRAPRRFPETRARMYTGRPAFLEIVPRGEARRASAPAAPPCPPPTAPPRGTRRRC
ncbi:MAG TPA: transposase [Candidatus Dormibacteraeota bacterium]